MLEKTVSIEFNQQISNNTLILYLAKLMYNNMFNLNNI